MYTSYLRLTFINENRYLRYEWWVYKTSLGNDFVVILFKWIPWMPQLYAPVKLTLLRPCGVIIDAYRARYLFRIVKLELMCDLCDLFTETRESKDFVKTNTVGCRKCDFLFWQLFYFCLRNGPSVTIHYEKPISIFKGDALTKKKR